MPAQESYDSAIDVSDIAPRPNPVGTSAFVLVLLLTGLNLSGSTAEDVASRAAWGAGIGLGLTILADARSGIRNLIRADIFSMLALYFLTFFEFLFPQPTFNMMVNARDTQAASLAVLVAMAGLAIGRHLATWRAHPFKEMFVRPIPQSWMFWTFWLCFVLGFIHMFLAVHFDVFELIEQFMAPRFSQPWQRGRFGDWKALLVELSLFLYLMPPIAGIMIARRQRYKKFQIFLCSLGLLFLYFYAFTSGTRNLFISYLVTFLIAYSFAVPIGRKRELIAVTLICMTLLGCSTIFMLRFRNIGFANYMNGRYVDQFASESSLFVDFNLYSLSRIMEVFPKRHPYLGLEVPYLAIVRPIPRAIWPGKPEGLSLSIEDAMGVEDMTVATTYIGEAHMCGGLWAVIVSSLIFGYLAGWWSQLASPKNSDLGILIYASGFFSAVITMRSMFVFTTALLPTAASLVLAAYLVRRLRPKPKFTYRDAIAMDKPVGPRPQVTQFRR